VLDVESFAAKLTESYPQCWLIAAAVTGDRVEADDIVQEAALIALGKRHEFTVGTNFAAWISQIVRLTALNYAKKSVRRGSVVTDPVAIDRSVASAVTTAKEGMNSVTAEGRLVQDQADFDDDVLSALDELGDEARACLLLRTVRHLSYREIADTLRVPEGTAMSHVHRAKQLLRDRLKQKRDTTNAVELVRVPKN
jgi:RNA polymerase sigma-70 factor (ECF subfamily)